VYTNLAGTAAFDWISGDRLKTMAVKYWIDDETMVFCHSWAGHISATEVLEFRSVAKAFVARDSLVDLTEVTSSDITPDSLRAFTQETIGRRRIAIIAPKPARFGMARMYESLANLKANPTRIGVFWTKEEAIGWLREGSVLSGQA
jgi:hypothetical protein